MSLAALMIALGTNIAGVMPVPLERPDVLAPPSPAPAARKPGDAPPARRDPDGEQADYPDTFQADASPVPDLVVRLGDRRTGPQLELGALGGGSARASRLVHVGVGFDF